MGNIANSKMDLPAGEEYLSQCCLALRECASVRLIHAPKQLREIIENTIQKHWSPGGIKIMDADSLWEYRLKGLPFWNSFSPLRSLQVHSLICYMLDNMQVMGWDVQTSTDLSRSKDLSTFFLKKQNKTRKERDDPRQMFSATLADKNKVYVVNAPKAVITQLNTIFSNHWPKGVARVQRTKYGYIFTLKGEPWSDKKTASLQASSLVHRLVYMMGLLGWDVSTIARVKNYRDTIFFRQKRMKKFDDLVPCFLSISFFGKNRLRLIHCSDPTLADSIHSFLSDTWEAGIENVRKYHGTIEFRLNGKPFWADSTDGIDSKLLICALLGELQKNGWRIHNFISSTRSLENKGTLLFKKETASTAPPMCISFDDEDKIRLISAGDDVKCVVRNVITQRLGQNGIVREGNFRNCWEFKLHGAPWTGNSSDEGIKVRSLLCHILQKLSFKGWYVMTSFDVSSKISKSDDRHPQPLDAQSWYFCKKENIDQAVKLWKRTADIDAPPKNKGKPEIPAKEVPTEAPIVECEEVKAEFTIPKLERSEVISPCTEDITTPESSLTNLIKDMKTEVKLTRQPSQNITYIETKSVEINTNDCSKSVEINTHDCSKPVEINTNDCSKPVEINTHDCSKPVEINTNDCSKDPLIVEEESLEPVMCGNDTISVIPLDCKSISPAPSNEEFELPEIYDDIIDTIYSHPPVFEKK